MKILTRSEFGNLYEDYKNWASSQKDQTDGYEYEKSFDDFLQSMGKKLFKETTSAATELKPRLKKK